jgi:hypothetical protein
MTYRFSVLSALAAICAMTSGCATITRGTTEVLVIETTPSGADVELSNGSRCKSPCSLELKRKNNIVVDISRTGFDPVRVNVLSQIAGAGAAGMAGNVVFGGLIGVGVDAATGATKQLKPNPVIVTLVPTAVPEKLEASVPAVQGGSDVVLTQARERCAAVGFTEDSADFRPCVLEQIRNMSGTK